MAEIIPMSELQPASQALLARMEAAQLERLQQMLQKSPLSYHQKKISVTFSAGIAGLRDLDNGASLIQRADRALYNAKTLGRNRVEIDTSMAPLE